MNLSLKIQNRISPCPLTLAALAVRVEHSFRSSPRPKIRYSSFDTVFSYLNKQSCYFVSEVISPFLRKLLPAKCFFNPALIVPPRQLLVPKLPYPPFFTSSPSPIISKKKFSSIEEPLPLMAELKEEKLQEILPIKKTFSPPSFRQGILRQSKEGLIYLELSDKDLNIFFSLLNENEAERADDDEELKILGAHVPVILPDEHQAKKGWDLSKKLGKSFSFSFKSCFSLSYPQEWPEMEKVWYVTIDSPQLKELREQFLLPTTIRGHDFYVLLAFKKKSNSGLNQPSTFRINVSCYAA